MPDKIWDFQDVIAEVLENCGLKMLQYSRVVWRHGEPREKFVSNQEYLLSLKDEFGHEKRVTLFIDDHTTDKSVRSELAKKLEEQ